MMNAKMGARCRRWHVTEIETSEPGVMEQTVRYVAKLFEAEFVGGVKSTVNEPPR